MLEIIVRTLHMFLHKTVIIILSKLFRLLLRIININRFILMNTLYFCLQEAVEHMHEIPTKVIRVDPFHPEVAIIKHAAALIQKAHLVVFPTQTVYGLGADALQPQAIERIFTAKRRPFSDPLTGHISNRSILQTLVGDVPLAAHKL